MDPQEPNIQPRERSPLAEIIAVALPSAGTMLSYPIMQIVDTKMVSELGPVAVSAQGNGGLAVWVFGSIVVGAMSVVNTYVSQHLGGDRPKRTSAYAWNGLWICAVASVLLLVCIPLIPAYFRLFGHSNELLRTESVYAQISLAGGFFMMASRTIHQFFYGVHKPNVVFFTAFVAHAANIGLNYVLIFGKLGLPAMGVAGAAIGTVVATMIEFALPMALFLTPKYHDQYATRTSWRLNWERIKDLVRIGWPAGLQTGNEMICWKVFMLGLVGSFGAVQSAASWVALRYMMLSFMPAIGISFAITAVVGRWIGKGDRDEAARRARVGVAISIVYMTACGVIMVVFREPLIRAFISEEYDAEQAAEVLRVGSLVMICAAVFQIFDALGIALTGALRGAGDTVIPGVLNAVLAWTFLIGLGWLIASQRPDLGSLGPWIGAAAFIIALGAVLAWRWGSGAWRSIEVTPERRRSVPGAGTDPAAAPPLEAGPDQPYTPAFESAP